MRDGDVIHSPSPDLMTVSLKVPPVSQFALFFQKLSPAIGSMLRLNVGHASCNPLA